jgi:type II secretory pathway pseudopilin PulG
MTVVIIITIFAAIAIPVATQQLKERRSQQAAEQVALMYRGARMRAMGRGSAVLVRFTDVSRGRVEVREAQRGSGAGDGCEALPVSSCLLPNWNGPADEDYRAVGTLDIAQRGEYGDVSIGMMDRSSASVSTLDVCFTPMGRTFFRTDPDQPLAPLAETHFAEVWRGEESAPLGRTRKVLILPNGTARVQ